MRHVLLAFLLVAGGAVGYAQFEGTLAGVWDEGNAGATFEANMTQEGTADPGHAYEDVDNDGRFVEDRDVPIDDAEIKDGQYAVTDPDHGLVVPKSVGSIEAPAGTVELTAGENGHLIVDVRLEAGQTVRLTAGTTAKLDDLNAEADQAIQLDAVGALELESASLEAGEHVQATAGERVYARSATVQAADEIRFESEASAVLVNAASLESEGPIRLDAAGSARADDAMLETDADVHLSAGEDVYVKRAAIQTSANVTLTAGTSEATIFVQDARVEDADDTAQAGPEGVEIVGEPAEGSIEG